MTLDQVETAFVPTYNLDLSALGAQARRLAEAQTADRFSEAQLDYAERLTAEGQDRTLLSPARGCCGSHRY